MWSYILNLATTALAVFTLAKDWKAHQSHWRRGIVIGLIFLFGTAALVNTHFSNKKAIEQRQDAKRDRTNAETQRTTDQATISGLKTAVDTANKSQENNTKHFIASFTVLTGKLNDLQTQVKTAGLQKEANQLRAELAATRSALAIPKAELLATFGKRQSELGVKETSGQANSDGSVSFSLTVLNNSEVQAKDGTVFLNLCRGCSYAVEPERSMKAPGSTEQQRMMPFDYLSAQTAIFVPLKVTPPKGGHKFEINVLMKCENCVVHEADRLSVDY